MDNNPQQPLERDLPNTTVKLVFEQIDTDEPDIKGCKVYLEYKNRIITEKVLISEDRTVAECWAAEVFDFVRDQLAAKMAAQSNVVFSAPKKEDMN